MTAAALEYLSHSRLSCYRSCSLQFRFRYVDKLPRAFIAAPLAFGVAFHKAVEEGLVALMSGEFPPVDELVQIFARDLDAHDPAIPIRFGEKESRDAMMEQARTMLTAWATWPRPAARILAVEQDFRIPIAEWLPPLVGRVDQVLEFDDHVEILDVKTSRSRWSAGDVEEHAGQLAVYRAGLQDLVRDIGKPVRLGFEIITKTKTPVVERLYLEGGESFERQMKAATLVAEGVERGIFIPSPGWQCSGCPFREACRIW